MNGLKKTEYLLQSVVAGSLLIAVVLTSPTLAGEPNYSRLFAGLDACFELYDLTANKLVVRSNPRRCAQRTSPCSTFKVPLALMSFDAGILEDENSAMKWDGTKSSREVWNHDQTASTWMQNSVVWFSQRLTPLLGIDRVKADLSRFDYGNQDVSGGLTTAWLDSTLTISPDEQLRFWKRFWREALPVSPHAFAMTKQIVLVDTSLAGWTLHGKTGSGSAGLGWFVGHVQRGDREYLFVTSFTEREKSIGDRPGGWVARDLSKTILKELGVY